MSFITKNVVSISLLIFIAVIPIVSSSTMYQVLTEINKPIDKINLPKGILLIDKLIHPQLNITDQLNKINKLKLELRKLGQKKQQSISLSLIRHMLYGINPASTTPYSYNQKILNASSKEKVRLSLLSYYLKTKTGTCISMPLLFLILANDITDQLTLSTYDDHVFLIFKNNPHLYYEATSNQVLPIRTLLNQVSSDDTNQIIPLKRHEVLLNYFHLYGIHLFNQGQFTQARTVFRFIGKKFKTDKKYRKNLRAVYGQLYLKTNQEVFRQLYNHY